MNCQNILTIIVLDYFPDKYIIKLLAMERN